MYRLAGLVLAIAALGSVAVAGPGTFDPDPPQAGLEVKVIYDPAGGPLAASTQGFIHYGFNDWHPTVDPDPEMVTTNGGMYKVVVSVPSQATEMNYVFHDADGIWDNNDGWNYIMAVTNGLPNAGVTTAPDPIVANQSVTITYDANGRVLELAEAVYMHYGFNNWGYVAAADVEMTETSPGSAVYEVTVPVKSYAEEMNITFTDGEFTDDNNDGFDWNFIVTGTIPRVSVYPDPPVAGEDVTITYNPEDGVLDGVASVYIHYGFNDFNPTIDPDPLMTSNGDVWEITVPVDFRACTLDMVFNDGGSTWDNNDNNDYTFDTVGCVPLTSEVDGLYVAKIIDEFLPELSTLNIGIAGNLQDGAAMVIFINEEDATGQTELQADGADGLEPMRAASRRLDTFACDTVGTGTQLPIEADYALYANRQGSRIYFDEYTLSSTAQDTLNCCAGGTINVYASQLYTGYTDINDANEAWEGDQGFGYFGGFNDTNTNSVFAEVETGLEVAIPLSVIGNGVGTGEPIEIFVAMMPNQNGTDGQFSNQTLPAGSGDYCSPAEMFPLRADISSYATVFSAASVNSLPNFTGFAEGEIDPSEYNGSADAVQSCDAAEAVADTRVTVQPIAIQGEDVTVWYVSTNGPLDGVTAIDMKYGFDGDLSTPATIAMVATNGYTGSEFKATVTMPGTALQFDMYFESGVLADDNGGNDYHFDVNRVPPAAPVVIDPDPAEAGKEVTIQYDPTGRVLEGAGQVSIHYGFNGWNGPTDAQMNLNANCVWEITITVAAYAEGAQGLNMVFFEGGTWDNNDGNDWHFQVDNASGPPPWVMDGYVDGCATLVATSTNGLRHLYAGVRDGYLYVATERADHAAAQDAFIYISSNGTTTTVGSAWAKAGLTLERVGFLAQEDTNGWTGWFDLPDGALRQNTGENLDLPILEGQIEMASSFSAGVPTTVLLAATQYVGSDTGAMIYDYQAPEGNGDNNVDAGEYAVVNIVDIQTPATFPAADLNEDCGIDLVDYALFQSCLAGPETTPACAEYDADFNDDGDVDLADFAYFAQEFEG